MSDIKIRKRRFDWAPIRQSWPAVWELIRPQLPLWSFGLMLLLIDRAAGLILPAAPKFLLDDIIPRKDGAALAQLVGVVVAAAVVQGVCAWLLTQTISKAGQRLMARLRERLLDHLLRLPISYFDNKKSGEVVSRVLNDVDGVRVLVGTGMIEIVGGLLTALFSFAILFYLQWKLTLVVLGFLVVLAVVLGVVMTRLGKLFRQRQEMVGDLSGRVGEVASGIRVIKAFGTEDRERTHFHGGVTKLLGAVLSTITAVSVLALTLSLLLGTLGGTLLYLAGNQLIDGSLTAGELITYLLYLGFMIAPLGGTLMNATLLSEAFAGIARMRETLELLPEQSAGERTVPPDPRCEIEFRDVSFAYEPERPVLRGVSFRAAAGSTTALVGPSGAGKSTVAGIVAAFHAPTSGAVLLDGEDVRAFSLASYRGLLGCVLQDPFLFSGTVRENLLYAAPNCTDADLLRAIKLAHCEAFIDELPQKLDTLIGERGVKLSGGQRQRLAIARALLANPRILILDEATSALDSESEAAVQAGLAALRRGRTTFVIAHRLSTIRNADQVLVLDRGEVIEAGSHSDLVARRGRYYQMLLLQNALGSDVFLAPGEAPTEDSPAEVEEAPGRGWKGFEG